MLSDAIRRNMSNNNLLGMLTKKQKMEEGSPLGYFLRCIIEGNIRRQFAESSQMPNPNTSSGSMSEPPSVNPLQNAITNRISGPFQGGS